MTDITLVKNESMELEGFTASDRRAYARLRKIIKEMGCGELLTLRYWFKRDGPFHRKHMKMLRTFWESQECFDDFDRFRDWVHVGAGHVNWVPDPAGSAKMIAVVKSINYAEVDDEEMRRIHESTKEFFRTGHAQTRLWPGLSPAMRAAGAESMLEQFEREQ